MDKSNVNSGDYVGVAVDSGRCVDERMDKEGKSLGHQLPGASEHILDLMMMAIQKSGGEVDETALFEMADAVFGSEKARKHNLVAGVHIDDEHGNMSVQECEERVSGCGYDNVRTQVLKTVFDIEVDYSPGARIQAAREKGWGVQVLTGDHRDPGIDETVTAAINYVTGKTLDTAVLWEEGRTPSFNHDIWVVEVLMSEMVGQLKENGFEEAVKLLEENAMKWSRDIYGETLNVLSGGVLTGADLIEIR